MKVAGVNIALGIAGGGLFAQGNPISGVALMVAGILLCIELNKKSPPSQEASDR